MTQTLDLARKELLNAYNLGTNSAAALIDTLQQYTRSLRLEASQQEFIEQMYHKIAQSSAMSEAAVDTYLYLDGIDLKRVTEQVEVTNATQA